jgi:hypothetical protein
VAGHPLRSAIGHWLGEPLPHQLPDRPQVPLPAVCLHTPFVSRPYAVLANLSARYSPLEGRYLRVTHPFATRRFVLLLISPFDLHALGTPPAFILSQDQTLRLIFSFFLLLKGIVPKDNARRRFRTFPSTLYLLRFCSGQRRSFCAHRSSRSIGHKNPPSKTCLRRRQIERHGKIFLHFPDKRVCSLCPPQLFVIEHAYLRQFLLFSNKRSVL